MKERGLSVIDVIVVVAVDIVAGDGAGASANAVALVGRSGVKAGTWTLPMLGSDEGSIKLWHKARRVTEESDNTTGSFGAPAAGSGGTL